MSFFRKKSKPVDAGQTSCSVLVQEIGENQRQEERRADRRHGCDLPAFCEAVAGKERTAWTAHVNNISASGLALHAERRFEPGTILGIMPGRTDICPSNLWARVVRVQPDGSGGWIMGCRLACRLSDEEVHQLLETWGDRKTQGMDG
jgi:hypothetical protein